MIDDTETQSQITEIKNYVPSHEQLSRATKVITLASRCAQNNINYAIGGGYGEDALLSQLTRDHNDIDLLVAPESLQTLQTLITDAYSLTEEKVTQEGTVYVYKDADGFKLELAPTSNITDLGVATLSELLPIEPNGYLLGNNIKVIPLDTQIKLNNMQNERARKYGWSDYKHKQHKDAVIALIKSQQQI